MTSAQDLKVSDDWDTSIQEQIDRSKAVIVINGEIPSRWTMKEVDTAKALGKPIINVGEDRFYDTGNSTQIASLDQLAEVLGKLPK